VKVNLKKAVLLINLGTPDNCDEEAVGRYLREFLNDPYVIDIPQPLRWLLVNALIVPRRKRRATEAYKLIWTATGSPLLQMSLAFKEKLARELSEHQVHLGMRYGRPSLRSEIEKIVGANPPEILVWPLYPQYAGSSSETALHEVRQILAEMKYAGRVIYLEEFSENKDVAAIWVENILRAARDFKAQKLVLSYHGLPISHLKKISKGCQGEGECSLKLTNENKMCYRRQAYATSHEIRKLLFSEPRDEISFTARDVEISFQSRLTKGWIKPFSDEVYHSLPAQGATRILVACPSFVVDCLETLEEVAIRERAQFIKSGGEDMRLVPCLNDSEAWIKAAAKIVRADKSWKPLYTAGGPL
jgi:protoporphyrin/coproporphyrin ferrochelatase